MKKLILILTAICWHHSYSQGLNNMFLYGYTLPNGGIVDFNTGLPVIIPDSSRPIRMNISNANLTDLNGNLLFYTNGVRIVDSSQQIMQNGDSLNPSAYTTDWWYEGLRIPQGDIFIPMPGDTSLYYLFHETLNNSSNLQVRKIYYSIINKTLNGGLGGLQKKIKFSFKILYQLVKLRHANMRMAETGG